MNGTEDLAIDQHAGVDTPIEIPDTLAALGVTEAGIKALAGGLAEHATNAHDAETVENPGKPADVPLPLDPEDDDDNGDGFERYNANKAMTAIIAKNTEVQSDRDEWNRLKKETAEAKKTLDEGEAALARIISAFAKAREQQNSPQAFLPLPDGTAAVNSNCPWERAHPGVVCVICREARKANLNPDAQSEVHPEHAGHVGVAHDAYVETVMTPLKSKLEVKSVYIRAEDLETLDADQVQQLLAWVDQSGPIPPPILATSHLAAAAGSLAQLCLNCDTRLADANDAEGFYPEGARVGLDCDAVAHAKLDETIQADIAAIETQGDVDQLVETTGLTDAEAEAKVRKVREKAHRYPKKKKTRARR